MNEDARDKKLGLWADPHPMPPWDWRKNEKEKRSKKCERMDSDKKGEPMKMFEDDAKLVFVPPHNYHRIATLKKGKDVTLIHPDEPSSRDKIILCVSKSDPTVYLLCTGDVPADYIPVGKLPYIVGSFPYIVGSNVELDKVFQWLNTQE